MMRSHRAIILAVVIFGGLFAFKLLHGGSNTADSQWPRKIWQIATKPEFAEKWQEKTATWTEMNPGWQHTLVGSEDMDVYVHQKFAHRPDIVGFWDELDLAIAKTDFFRYLVLFAEGGVYSDLDTTALVPIDEWIPPEYKSSDIRVVAGLEYADHTYRIFPRHISFCQWTLMTRPGSMVYDHVLTKLMAHIEYVARVQKVPISNITLTREEILASTGPGAYSDAVLAAVRYQLQDPSLNWDIFFGLQEPKLFGDVLVLPINGFGFGQKHSNSSKPEWGRPLARHHFGSSWFKKGPKAQQQKTVPKERAERRRDR